MKTVGFAVCGSFCTFDAVFEQMQGLKDAGYDLLPIMSEISYSSDTRFGSAEYWRERAEHITEKRIIHTIPGAEPIGPQKLLDALIIAPCTGNTLAKLCTGVTDTAVTLAAKAHLRNERPLIIAVSTNDGLSNAAKNIGALLNRKNIYFVPFGQDNAAGKPRSTVADFTLIKDTLQQAFEGRQLQPLITQAH